MAIWSIFDRFCGHSVDFVAIWYVLWSFATYFPVLVCCTMENLAALLSTSVDSVVSPSLSASAERVYWVFRRINGKSKVFGRRPDWPEIFRHWGKDFPKKMCTTWLNFGTICKPSTFKKCQC
jgi:hypothetical protein